MEEIAASSESPPLEGLSPDRKLAQLYKSMRPAVELIPGVSLSALVNTVWLPGDDKVRRRLTTALIDECCTTFCVDRLYFLSHSISKAMLSESWIPVPMEPEEGAAPLPPPPSFDPSSIEFKVHWLCL